MNGEAANDGCVSIACNNSIMNLAGEIQGYAVETPKPALTSKAGLSVTHFRRTLTQDSATAVFKTFEA
jgi:hypothetical protein